MRGPLLGLGDMMGGLMAGDDDEELLQSIRLATAAARRRNAAGSSRTGSTGAGSGDGFTEDASSSVPRYVGPQAACVHVCQLPPHAHTALADPAPASSCHPSRSAWELCAPVRQNRRLPRGQALAPALVPAQVPALVPAQAPGLVVGARHRRWVAVLVLVLGTS